MIDIESTVQADALQCWKYFDGKRPKWIFDGITIWCHECEGGCGLNTIKWWPTGFTRPHQIETVQLSLFDGGEQ